MQKTGQIKPLVFKSLTFHKKRRPMGGCRIQTKTDKIKNRIFWRKTEF